MLPLLNEVFDVSKVLKMACIAFFARGLYGKCTFVAYGCLSEGLCVSNGCVGFVWLFQLNFLLSFTIGR